MFRRILRMLLPDKRSAFLWGARQTGKSTYLKHAYPQARYYDFLLTDILMKYEVKPYLFREEVLAGLDKGWGDLIVIDEVQKIPAILDEVHWLIEHTNAQFILCGSSARKMKKVGANLLGGRGLRYNFYPLTTREIENFDLLRALNNGLLPSHYLSNDVEILCDAYINNYLNEEIRSEGLVRNLPQFSRFLDSLAFTHGETINFSNIARDCGVTSKTVQGFYEILVETLLGHFISPYCKKVKRDIISKAPKFYLFDVGVANFLCGRSVTALQGITAGRAFEHFILMELLAYKGLDRKRFAISYWRTKSGHEVDFILGNGEIAVEIKISHTVHQADLKGLIAFCEEHSPRRAIAVSQDAKARLLQVNEGCRIEILPWREFLNELWDGKII